MIILYVVTSGRSIATFLESIPGGVEEPLEQLGHNMLFLMLSVEQACLAWVTESLVSPVLTAVTAAFTSGLPIDKSRLDMSDSCVA